MLLAAVMLITYVPALTLWPVRQYAAFVQAPR
jgi:hypothetical protein